MLYKEWLASRSRFYFVTAAYIVLILGTLLRYFGTSVGSTLYNIWTDYNVFVVFITALLSSAGNIAEEVEKQTVSFILTKPVSRRQIYWSKIGVSAAIWAGPYLVANIPMLAFDQFLTHNNLGDYISYLVMGLLLGLFIIGLAAVVSMFVSNTIFVLLITGVALPFIALIATGIRNLPYRNGILWANERPALLIVFGMLAVGLYVTAYVIFRRKNF